MKRTLKYFSAVIGYPAEICARSPQLADEGLEHSAYFIRNLPESEMCVFYKFQVQTCPYVYMTLLQVSQLLPAKWFETLFFKALGSDLGT